MKNAASKNNTLLGTSIMIQPIAGYPGYVVFDRFLGFPISTSPYCKTAAFLNSVSDLKCSQHGFIKRQIRLSIELPFLETVFVDTGIRTLYLLNLSCTNLQRLNCVFFIFFAPVQILLHVTLTNYNSTIPTIMITYMYKLQSTTVFIIISPQISSYMQIKLLIVSDAGLR